MKNVGNQTISVTTDFHCMDSNLFYEKHIDLVQNKSNNLIMIFFLVNYPFKGKKILPEVRMLKEK